MQDSRSSRSRLGRAIATVAVVAVTAVGLSATAGSAQSSGKADPNGVLEFATSLSVSGTDRALDPTKSRSVGDFQHLNLIYFTLLQAQDNGDYKPGLAQSYKVEGDNAVTLTLRPNLKFSDGTALDAEAVKFSIDRAVAAKNTNFAPEINNVQSVDVISPTMLKITLKTPTIGSFFELLAGRETMPVSPTAAAGDLTANPIGAGPMTVDSFTSGSKLSLRKNDGFYDSKKWKLGGVDFIEAAAGAPRVTALRSGDANLSELDASQSKDFKGSSNTTVEAVASDANFLYLATCKSQPPFDNPTFRQAVETALDRNAVNQVLLDGAGEPMWTMWPESSGFFTKSTDGKYAFNVKKAKKLFKEAGWNSADTLPIGYSANSEQLKTWGEIFQSLMADAGVKVELVPLQDIVTQFYRNVQTPAAVSLWIRPGLQKVTRAFGANSVANVCAYSDDELNGLAADIAALPPGDPKLAKLWDQVNTKITDEVLWNFGVWQPLVYGWNNKEVAGVDRISPLLQGPDFSTIYIKK